MQHLQAMHAALLLATAAIAATGAAARDTYTWSAANGNFTVNDVSFNTRSGHWRPGEVATIVVHGVIPSKHIVAGATSWELFEQGQPHKISQGTADYFKCTNKGCYTDEPISLYLSKPHQVPTDFKLKFTTVIPSATTSGHYTLVVWGEDQDHSPYDFSASIRFNLTSSEPEAEPAPTPTPAPIATVPEEQQFKWSVQTGNFTVWVVNMRTPSRTWQPGETATVEFAGEVINKRIEAGTLKYQVWESYVEHFVAQGNSPYFQCTHKGCDPTKAVALAIDYPVHRPSPYKMHFTFPIPEPKKTGDFRVVVWGEDHTPYDFSLTITFNATTAAY